MKTYKYIGLFRNSKGNEYTLSVYCNGTIEAFFLLTANAIRSGRHYQIKTITDERGNIIKVDDINKIKFIFD